MSKYAAKSAVEAQGFKFTLSMTVTRGYTKADGTKGKLGDGESTRNTIYIAFLNGCRGGFHRNYSLDKMMEYLNSPAALAKATERLAKKAAETNTTVEAVQSIEPIVSEEEISTEINLEEIEVAADGDTLSDEPIESVIVEEVVEEVNVEAPKPKRNRSKKAAEVVE